MNARRQIWLTWILVVVFCCGGLASAGAKTRIVYHVMNGNAAVRSDEEVENAISRACAIAGAFRQFTLADLDEIALRALIRPNGLRVDVALLAECLREEAKAHPRGVFSPATVEQVVILDKAQVRARGVPAELRAFVEYNGAKDVVFVKDSPERWILIDDSSGVADEGRRLWREGLNDHECLLIARVQEQRAVDLFSFFAAFCAKRLSSATDAGEEKAGSGGIEAPESVSLEASAKIAIAWRATVLLCGNFDANRAFERESHSAADSPVHQLFAAAGGAGVVSKRIAKWQDNPAEFKEIAVKLRFSR